MKQTHNGSDSNGHLIEVKNLKKYFPVRGGLLQRVVGLGAGGG